MDLISNASLSALEINKCSQNDLKFLLDIFYSNTALLWFGRVFVFIFTAYLYLGLAKITEVFMINIENLTCHLSLNQSHNDQKKCSNQMIYNKIVNFTFQFLGSNLFEIIYPLIEVVYIMLSRVQPISSVSIIMATSSFNVLVITSCCLLSLNSRKFLKFNSSSLFYNFTFWSSISFIWLYLILNHITPNQIDLWEALITFFFYFAMVACSLFVDKLAYKHLKSNKSKHLVDVQNFESSSLKISRLEKLSKRLDKYTTLGESQKFKILEYYCDYLRDHSVLYYKIQAIRKLTGSSGSLTITNELKEILDIFEPDLYLNGNNLYEEDIKTINDIFDLQLDEEEEKLTNNIDKNFSIIKPFKDLKAIIEFSSLMYGFNINSSKTMVYLTRKNNFDLQISIILNTIDGTMFSFQDYQPLENTIVQFEPFETCKEIPIFKINNVNLSSGQNFYLRMEIHPENMAVAKAGLTSFSMVVSVNEENKQNLEFEGKFYEIKSTDDSLSLKLKRKYGSFGMLAARLELFTKNLNIVYHQQDFEFRNGELEKRIDINIKDLIGNFLKDKFYIRLAYTNQNDLENFTISNENVVVFIRKNPILESNYDLMVKNLKSSLYYNHRTKKSSILDQFKNACRVNEGETSPHLIDFILHSVSFGWKILFSFIPPPVCVFFSFSISLLIIVVLVYLCVNISLIFGCLIGLNGYLVSLTFISIGLGIPRLIASNLSIIKEKTADNSIGLMTCYNSMNVFWSLGFPWLITSIFFKINGLAFMINDASVLSTSLLSFSILNVLSIKFIYLAKYVEKIDERNRGKTSKLLRKSISIILFMFWILFVFYNFLHSFNFISF